VHAHEHPSKRACAPDEGDDDVKREGRGEPRRTRVEPPPRGVAGEVPREVGEVPYEKIDREQGQRQRDGAPSTAEHEQDRERQLSGACDQTELLVQCHSILYRSLRGGSVGKMAKGTRIAWFSFWAPVLAGCTITTTSPNGSGGAGGGDASGGSVCAMACAKLD